MPCPLPSRSRVTDAPSSAGCPGHAPISRRRRDLYLCALGVTSLIATGATLLAGCGSSGATTTTAASTKQRTGKATIR